VKSILVISAHPDDETLGAGGLICKYSNLNYNVFVLTISGHLPPLYSTEDYNTTIKEAKSAYKTLGVVDYKFLDIPATFVKDKPINELNNEIFSIVKEIEPEIVVFPFYDRHTDHRAVFDSTMVATRPVKEAKCIKLLAAYETLSETHWNSPYIEPNFNPNMIVDISHDIKKKLDASRCYKSQILDKEGPRSIKAIESLAHFRGSQAGFDYGEAYTIIRMLY
tara:strand:+ start:3237 stop:3902 length:666 start_codon:yes stop_codon:yes gene_type:complete